MSHRPDPVALFRSVPVVPVVVIDDPAAAVPLAAALVAGGLPVIEITLRTGAALDALARIAQEVPGAVAGAGTVLNAGQLSEVLDAGAKFAVSPGATPALLAAFAAAPVPCLPGIATASEGMGVLEAGFHAVKFFPAEAMGGVATLKALNGPLPALQFCPTGGIDVQRAATYLGLKHVMTVGGTWVAPNDLIKARAFDQIAALARAASALDRARPAA